MVKYKLQSGKEIYLDKILMYQLDTLIYNVKEDWDFVIVITGDRMVRTGKSVFAMTIGAYLADRLKTPFDLSNIFFESQRMIDGAQHKPKNSVILYDEAREGLAANKNSMQLQRDLLDYFSECGQLNHIFVIVLPDFFELKENMAVARSECLINVWRSAVKKMRDIYGEGTPIPLVDFKRGYFEFFSRKKKSLLYDLAKSCRRKNYQLVKPDLKGRFTNFYPLDEKKYRKMKSEALKRFNERKATEKATKTDVIRDKIIHDKRLAAPDKTCQAIAQELENEYDYAISRRQINRILGGKPSD